MTSGPRVHTEARRAEAIRAQQGPALGPEAIDEPMPALDGGWPDTVHSEGTQDKKQEDKMTNAKPTKAAPTTAAPKPATAPVAAPAPQSATPPAPTDDLSTPKPAPRIAGRIGIAPARKSRGFLKVALVSVSYGGKTFSALQMAKGIVEGLGRSVDRRGAGVEWWNYQLEPKGPARVLVVDTEQSAGDYDHLFPFDICAISQPYTLPRYREGYELAIAGGYDVLVIDSGSHLWSGEGGVLQQVDAMGGDKRQAWAKVNPTWEAFKTGIILQGKIHTIVCFRAKADYEVVNGKRIKVGLDPIARDQIEYEFNVALNLDHQGHLASVEKDRTGLFRETPPFLITPETGRSLVEWRMSGAAEEAELARPVVEKPQAGPAVVRATPEQQTEIRALCAKLGGTVAHAKEMAGLPLGPSSTEDATKLIAYLKNLGEAA